MSKWVFWLFEIKLGKNCTNIKLGKKTQKKKNIVVDTASKLCNYLPKIHVDEYNKISPNIKKKLGKKYSFHNLGLDDYDYSLWFEESVDLPPMPPLENDKEEIKAGKRLKNLNSEQNIN